MITITIFLIVLMITLVGAFGSIFMSLTGLASILVLTSIIVVIIEFLKGKLGTETKPQYLPNEKKTNPFMTLLVVFFALFPLWGLLFSKVTDEKSFIDVYLLCFIIWFIIFLLVLPIYIGVTHSQKNNIIMEFIKKYNIKYKESFFQPFHFFYDGSDLTNEVTINFPHWTYSNHDRSQDKTYHDNKIIIEPSVFRYDGYTITCSNVRWFVRFLNEFREKNPSSRLARSIYKLVPR